MNEKVWQRIIKGYIKNYESIHDLSKSNILDSDGEQYQELMMQLLKEIIETFRQEVED